MNCQGALCGVVDWIDKIIVYKNVYYVNGKSTQKGVFKIVKSTHNYIHCIERMRNACYNCRKQIYKEVLTYMFANTIKEILEDYKKAGKILTQNDLANVLGMTKQSFSNKMQRDTFTAEEVVMIAEYLNMKAILKGENEYIIK